MQTDMRYGIRTILTGVWTFGSCFKPFHCWKFEMVTTPMLSSLELRLGNLRMDFH